MKRIAFIIVGLLLVAITSFAGPGDLVQEGVDFNTIQGGSVTASGVITGGVSVFAIASNSDQSLSGATIFGTLISGASNSLRPVTSGVSWTLPYATGSGANTLIYNANDTSISGDTIFLHVPAQTEVICNQHFVAGASKFCISGTTFEVTVYAVDSGQSVWTIKTVGSPTIEAD